MINAAPNSAGDLNGRAGKKNKYPSAPIDGFFT
jgi:hypothetical protein